MVTIFRAAKQADRVLIVDLYVAVVLEATGRASIPQAAWPNVRLYIPQRQRVHIKDKKLFGDLDRHSANRIFSEQLPGLKDRAVMLLRPFMIHDSGVGSVLDGAGFTYSMWKGYLKDETARRVVAWLDKHGIPWQTIHTSRPRFTRRPATLRRRPRAAHARPHPLVRNRPVRRVLRQCRAERGR